MAAKVLEAILKANPVVVFSRNPCPYCVNVKKLFDTLGVKYTEFGFGGNGKWCAWRLMGGMMMV